MNNRSKGFFLFFQMSDRGELKVRSIDVSGIKGDVVTVHLDAVNVAQVNIFRRALLGHIETYAIEYVTFYVNSSVECDETIAFYLGQIVIDNLLYQNGDGYSFMIEWQGPATGLREITTDDIPELPFRYQTPIMKLRPGDYVRAEVVVKKGRGIDHCKWRPVAHPAIQEEETGYRIVFKEIGMLDGPTIVERGLAKMKEAAAQPAQNIFTRQVLWKN